MPPNTAAILLIDNEAFIMTMLTKMLARLLPTIPVIQAQTATAGLSFLTSYQIILAIVDYYLPDMNGRQLIPAIHSYSPSTPIVLCTGAFLQMSDLEGLEIAAILFKPFRYIRIKQIIHTLIR